MQQLVKLITKASNYILVVLFLFIYLMHTVHTLAFLCLVRLYFDGPF